MRILMWLAMGFGAGCVLCAYGMNVAWILPMAGVCASFFLICLLFGRERNGLRTLSVLFLGCAVGLSWYLCHRNWYLSPLEAVDGREGVLTFTASDYSVETDYGIAVDGVITLKEKQYQLRAYLEEGTLLKPGDRVTGSFRQRVTTPDAQETSSYYQGKGIFLLLYQTGEIQTSIAEEVPLRFAPAVLRLGIKEILAETFPEDTAPFVKALLLGDSSGLDYETDSAFKISGIRHIIAVSGLHISILYSLICVVTFRRRYLTAAVAIPVLLLFAAVAGFTPSVTRACIMVWLMLLAGLFNREYDPATALAFSVLVMLIANPLAAASVSLQMSVACVAGILLFNGPINSWLKPRWKPKKGPISKLWAAFCTSISVSVSAVSLVTPLCALYFSTVSLVSVLTNLLTLWAVNLVFNGIIAVCLIHLILPGVAAGLAWLLAWPVRYVLFLAKTMASLPLAAVFTQSIYIVFWLIFVYVLLAVFLLSKERKPGMLLCCGILGLCLALLLSWAEPLTGVGITMLDVGQGQAILLQNEGKTFLVDCGGEDDSETADLIAEMLLSQGISRVDGILVTHYDRDHTGGLHHLLTRIDTDLLLLPDTRSDMELPETDGEIIWVWEDLELTFGDTHLTVYGPVYSGLDNENSLCVLFDTEKCDILITGDRSAFGERMLMRRRKLPDVDILVAGHHGAADSTSEELLRLVTPETVLISAARDNIYGHPSPALLERLEDFGCTVCRTDLHGTITIRR